MAQFELASNLPVEAAMWIMKRGSDLEVKTHPEKADAWLVIQNPGMFTCILSYNRKGNLFFQGAPHIIRAIKNLHTQYHDAGRRGFWFEYS